MTGPTSAAMLSSTAANGVQRRLRPPHPTPVTAALCGDILTGAVSLTAAIDEVGRLVTSWPGVDLVLMTMTTVAPEDATLWANLGGRAWLREWRPQGSRAPRVQPQGDAPPETALTMPWVSSLARRDGYAVVHDAAQLPDEADVDRREMTDVGVTAFVGVPLQADGTMFGALSTVRCSPGLWPEDQVADLRLLGASLSCRLATERAGVNLADAVARGEGARARQQKFFSSMGHELRTPITAILGTADILSLGANLLTAPAPEAVHTPDSPRGRELLDHAEALRVDAQLVASAGEQLIALIDELLITGQETGTGANTQPVNVAAALRDVVHWLNAAALNARVEVTTRVPDDLEVVTSPSGLRQILTNLVGNAIAYNKPGGTVEVTAVAATSESDEPRVRIMVRDDGPGLSPEQQSRVFDAFVRFSPDVKGTGLGLSLSRSIAERDGGLIGVESQPGRGATFWVDLPAPSGPLPHTRSAAAVSKAGAGAKPSAKPGSEPPHPERRETAKRRHTPRRLVATAGPRRWRGVGLPPQLQAVDAASRPSPAATELAVEILAGARSLDAGVVAAAELLGTHPGVDLVVAHLTAMPPHDEAAWTRLGGRTWVREWGRPGSPCSVMPTGPDDQRRMTLPMLSTWSKRMGHVIVPDIDTLPDFDRSELAACRISAMLMAHMIFDDVHYGGLAVDRARPGRWPDELISDILLLRGALSSRMAAERSRLSLAGAIERSDQARQVQQQFFSSLGHELRTPITEILGTADVLAMEADVLQAAVQDGRADAAAVQAHARTLAADAEVIGTAGEQLQDVVEELLGTGHALRSGTHTETINVSDTINDVMLSLNQTALTSGITLMSAAHPEIRVRATRTGLGKALTHLVQNAITFSPRGSVVTIDAVYSDTLDPGNPHAGDQNPCDRQDDDPGERFVVVSVSDHGPGLTDEQQSRVFDAFVRFADPNVPGKGLGLSLAKSLIERDGGTLGVDSRPGRGSRFWLRAPAPPY